MNNPTKYHIEYPIYMDHQLILIYLYHLKSVREYVECHEMETCYKIYDMKAKTCKKIHKK